MNRWVLGLVTVLCLSGCHRQAKPEPQSELIVPHASEETSTAGSSEPSPPKPGLRRPATSQERAAIEKLARAAESVRQLRFLHPITIEIEDGIAIASSLHDQIEDEEIERARLLYGALGLIDPDADLRALFSGVLGEQVIGYYDPKETRLVIRDDVMDGLLGTRGPKESDEARLVLVHELVHALQDQRLGLGDSYDQKRTADADNAFRAVIEGDATLAMLANALRSQGIPLSAATRGIQQMGSYIDVEAFIRGEKLDEAPAILRVTLVAPYLRGLQFIATVYSTGGWPSVNRAHRRPPTTTEQVLHPEKFANAERGELFEVSDIRGVEQAGYRRIAEDTLGELELSVYLGQSSPTGTNEAAAAGWGGDQLVVYRRADATAVVWWTTWDSEADAVEAYRAAQRVAPKKPSSLVERRGRAVLIVRDLPPRVHRAVRKAFGSFARKLKEGRPLQVTRNPVY
ncbi:MAG: hypothetical protein OEM15_13605 [Myxococcales bacterium]|nr:hypothetical protein [Myxococcales bacterium]MDH3484303.1 hypothetical protein [Myxococcales bacterium]